LRILSFDRERAVTVLLALCSALVAVTCGARSNLSPAPALKPALLASSPTPLAAPSAPPSAGAVEPPSARTEGALKLPHFHAALHELEAKKRKEHVRLLWFGDSHTAADFLPGATRRELSSRFGPGGPGYVALGVKNFRNFSAKLELSGNFRLEPDSPALAARQVDGIFGIYGRRALLQSADARASAVVLPQAVRGRVKWEVLYRLRAGASFRLLLGATSPLEVDERTPSVKTAGSPIRRFLREGGASDKLELRAGSGSVELFGAIAECSEPGIVIDNLGINGARAATPLAWEEGPFVAELAARHPQLVILAYGTNEVFEARAVDRYRDYFKDLVGRIRRAAPAADCLVLGPPDAAGNQNGSHPRVSEIDAVQQRAAAELGCAFFSQRQAMGGDGGFFRWSKESPPLASPDGIHLTNRGYERLGVEIAQALLSGY